MFPIILISFEKSWAKNYMDPIHCLPALATTSFTIFVGRVQAVKRLRPSETSFSINQAHTLACNLIASDRHLMQCVPICIFESRQLHLHLPATSVQSVKASTGVRPVFWFSSAPTFLFSYFRLAAARCTDIGCLVGKEAYLWRGHVMNTPKRHFSSSHPA